MLKVDPHISLLMRRVYYYTGSSIDFILDHGCSFDEFIYISIGTKLFHVNKVYFVKIISCNKIQENR
jgi:hypothetical protein